MSKASEIAMSMSSINEELVNDSNELEEKLAKEVIEKKPFKMSDYIKPQNVEGEDEVDKEASEKKKEETADNKILAGTGVAASGAALAKHTYDRGNLTGRETLYHNTRAEHVGSIKKNGLKGQYALDKDKAFTPDLLNHIDEKKLGNKVYFGRNKTVAESVGSKVIQEKGPHSRATLKAKVPTWKMKEVDNPELLGAKNGREFMDKLIAEKKKNGAKNLADLQLAMADEMPQVKKMLYTQGNMAYKTLGRKGTAVIEGDVAGKYFKGHKGYQKATMKEVGEFIKKNPKRFAKGVSQAVGGAALVGVGGKILTDGIKQKRAEKKSEKIASMLLEEANLVKVASSRGSRVDDVAFSLLEEAGFMR